MNKKAIWTTVLLGSLAGLCMYINRDLFSQAPLLVYHRIQARGPMMNRRAQNAPPQNGNPVLFGFSRKVTLKSVRVCIASEVETNKYARAVWELTTSSNSIPLRSLIYGQNIRGMQPARKGIQPDPLEPGVQYRLFLESSGGKAVHDFSTTPKQN
jgi:hypothetical protein